MTDTMGGRTPCGARLRPHVKFVYSIHRSWISWVGARSWELDRLTGAGTSWELGQPAAAGSWNELDFRRRPENELEKFSIVTFSRSWVHQINPTDFRPATSCDVLDFIENTGAGRKPFFRRRYFAERILETKKIF